MGVIAEGDIQINLRDAGARRELRALTADVKRTFEDISRQEAHPSVDLEHRDFDRAYQQVQRQIDKLRAERAKAIMRLDVRGMRQASAELALMDKKLRAIDGRRYAALLRVDVDKDSTRAIGDLEKTLDRLRDPRFFQNLRGKVGIDLEEADLRRVEQEIQNRINKIERRKATMVLTGDTGGIAAAAIELESLRRLQQRVIREADGLRKITRRDPLKIPAELDKRELREMENELMATIRKLQRERIRFRIEGDTHEIERVSGELAQLDADLVALRRRRVEIKLDFDRNVLQTGLRSLFGPGGLEAVQHRVQGLSRWWNEFGGSVLGAGIRLGPLTLRLRTAISVMTVLAPLLISLTGAFGAFGSVLYASVLGSLGPLTAGIGALGVGLAGIGGILVPLIGDFGKATKAIEAHEKAQREHGKGSDQAKKKLEVLNNVMGNVGPATRDAVRDVGKLGSTWTKLTRGARPAFFDTIAEGVRSAKSLMPLFARESVTTFQKASQEVRNWFKGLRGPEAKNIFRDLFAGAQKSIPSLQRSLGNIFTFLGRVAQAAMPLWTQFTDTLEGWTKGWADAGKDTDAVTKFLNRMKDALVDTAQFVGSLARLFHNLFMGGTEAGRGLLDTLTDLFNRWADWAGSIRGQRELHDWFSRSVALALDFARIMKNIGSFFIKATQHPFLVALATGLIKAVELLTDLINLVPGLNAAFAGIIIGATLLRALGPITKLIAAFSALKAAALAFAGAQGMGRVIEAISAFGVRYRNVLGRPGATVPGALTTVAAEGAAGAAGAAAGSRAAQTKAATDASKKLLVVERGVAREIAATTAASGTAAGTMANLAAVTRGVGIAAGLATAPFALLVGGLTAAAYAGIQLSGVQEDSIRKLQNFANVNKAADAGIRATTQANRGLTQASFASAQATLSVKTAQQDVNRLRREGKQGTTEMEQAVLNLTQAQEQERVANQGLLRIQRDAQEIANSRVRNEQTLLKQARENGASAEVLAVIQERVNKALNAQVAANVNVSRSMRGLAALTGETGQRAGFLVRQFQRFPKGDVVRKFFVQADTRQAEAGIRTINRLQKQGVDQKQIISVIANTDSAEMALLKLRALSKNLPKLTLDINAKDAATPRVNRAFSNAMKLVRPFIALLTGKDAASGKANSAVKAAQRLVRTFAAILRANDNASPVISSAMGLLNAFNGRTATASIVTVRKTVQVPGEPPRIVRGNAMGGIERKDAKRGLRVSRPTFVTGEEFRDEFVIATNPNYRTRNRKILKVAAAALGVRDLNDPEDVSSVIHDEPATYFGLPGYKKGKGPSKARKRKQRKITKRIRKDKSRWNKHVRNEQGKVERIEQDIDDKIQKRDQDETMFNIQLDNDPIIKTRLNAEGEDEDYVDEGAKQNRIGDIENLMAQTRTIVSRYDDLKAALKRAIDKMKDVTEKLRERLGKVTRKRVGKDNARKLRDELSSDISEIADNRREAEDRLHEVGDRSTRGEQRAEELQYQTYDSELKQTRAIAVQAQADRAGSADTDRQAEIDQAKAQADFYRKSSLVNEAALRTFGRAGTSPLAALEGLSGATGGSLTALKASPSVGAAIASAAAEGASKALATSGITNRAPEQEGGAGGGPSIIINTLHPGDPRTLDAIGQAATGGISLQGARISPRTGVGL